MLMYTLLQCLEKIKYELIQLKCSVGIHYSYRYVLVIWLYDTFHPIPTYSLKLFDIV